MTIAKTAVRYAAAGALLLALPGCTDWAMYDVDVAQGKVPYLATMRESVRPDPNEYLRGTVEGTVPVSSPMGDIPAAYTQAQIDSVAPTLQNPLSGNAAALARGQVVYDRACAVCHGPGGAGDGQVVKPAQVDGKSHPRFPFAPPINGAASAARSDGYLYAVIDVGRGFMPPYGERLTHTDRWAVVEYVRDLQRRAGAAAPTGAAAPAAGTATPQTAPAPAAATPPGAGTR